MSKKTTPTEAKRLSVLMLGGERETGERLWKSGGVDLSEAPDFHHETDLGSAVDRLRRGGVDLILYDLDGITESPLEGIGRLRDLAPRVAVVFLAGDEKKAREARSWGADDCLIKSEASLALLSVTARHHRERQRLREALGKQRQDYEVLAKRYQAVLRSTPNGLCTVTPYWTLRWANPTLARILCPGASSTVDLSGINLSSLFESAEEFEAFRSTAPQRIGMEGIDVRRLILKRLDGSPFAAEISTVLLDQESTSPGYVITISDKSREQEAWDKLEWLSSVVKDTADSVFVADPGGIILYVNPAFERITGYSEGEALGETPGALVKSGEHDEAFYEDLWNTILSGRVFRAVFCNRRKSGELYYEEQTITPVADGNGGVLQFISVGRDITERRKAEEALRRSEARYRAIVEDQTELIIRFLPDGRLTFVNEACCRFVGKPREEIVGTDFTGLVDPEHREGVWESIRGLCRENPVRGRESRLVNVGGEPRWFYWTNRAIFDREGNLIEYQGVGRDIADRKTAVETLRVSENRFSQVFHATPVPVGISTLDDGVFVDVNQSFLEFTGYNLEEVIGRTSFDLGLWVSKEQRRAFVSRVVSHGGIRNVPLSIRVRSGEIREGLASFELVELEGRDHLLVIFMDITDLRQAERALRDSESRNRAILSALPDTMFLLTDDGVYLDYHAPDPEILLHSPESFLFRRQRDILPPDLAVRYDALTQKVIETGRMQVMEYSVNHKGKAMHFEARVARCGPNQMLRIVRNITEERTLREQVLANERLAAVGQTAAIAAHCMKNIFTALKGSISLLGRAIDSGNLLAARQAHHLLDKSTARLYMLFMEMLDYSRQRVPNIRYVEIHPLLEEVADLMRLIDHKHVSIDYWVEEGSEVARLDREWIFRALVNLGSNSLDAVAYGGRISMRCRRKADSSAETPVDPSDRGRFPLVLEVIDNGCGIAKEHLPHIFKPLFTTKESRGTGLGLACVQQFVDSMGGTVEVESARDAGSTFRLVFPPEGAIGEMRLTEGNGSQTQDA